MHDVIVVGTGPAGASVARDLSKHGRKVLIVERGGAAPSSEGIFRTASVMGSVRVGENLEVTRAFAVGGTTAVYFAVANDPPLQPFLSLGVDLSTALQGARAELPLSLLPDSALGAQALRLRDAAGSLGHAWEKREMLIHANQRGQGYGDLTKWTAASYVDEAVTHGAELITRARVTRVLERDGSAQGIEYIVDGSGRGSEPRRALADKTILCAGAGATPAILRASGIKNVATGGFYCHPTFALFGIVPGLRAGETFPGSLGTDLGEGLSLGDANFSRTFYRMFMLANRRWVRLFRHSSSIGIGVMMREGLGGNFSEKGYHKRVEPEDLQRLEAGEVAAREIMESLGGKHVFRTDISAGHLGGMIQIGRDVDRHLETELRGLYVCDSSVVPHDVKVSPTLTLVCLGKYLADRLMA